MTNSQGTVTLKNSQISQQILQYPVCLESGNLVAEQNFQIPSVFLNRELFGSLSLSSGYLLKVESHCQTTAPFFIAIRP